MLDVYSRNQQHCRYQNVYNLWESVIICSVFPPEQVYSFMVDDDKKKSVDSIQQLLRRLKVIVYHYINKDGKYRAFKMPASDYIDAKDMVERARDYEKKADEVEAMEKTLENLEETATQMSPDEFKDAFGLVEVVDKPEDSTG